MKVFLQSWGPVILNRTGCVLTVVTVVLIAIRLWRHEFSTLASNLVTLTIDVVAVVLTFFPPGLWLTPDARGFLHHPWYGAYPAHVPYVEGMDLKPGQTAELRLYIPPENLQLKNGETRRIS